MSFKPVVKQHLTLPVLKLEIDKTVYFRVDSKMKEGKDITSGKKQEQMKNAVLVNVTNLEDNKPYQVVVPAILESVWKEDMKGEYLNKAFSVTKRKKPEGKRYHNYSIDEIEVSSSK